MKLILTILSILLSVIVNGQPTFPNDIAKTHTYQITANNDSASTMNWSDSMYRNRTVAVSGYITNVKNEYVKYTGPFNDTIWVYFIYYKNPLWGLGETMGKVVGAEKYESASSGVFATPIDSSGFVVQGISKGSEIKYKVILPNDGLYEIDFTTGSTQDDNIFYIYKDTVLVKIVQLPNTGDWNSLKTTISKDVPLSKGENNITIKSMGNGSSNFYWMAFNYGKIISTKYEPLQARLVKYLVPYGNKYKTNEGDIFEVWFGQGYDTMEWIDLRK